MQTLDAVLADQSFFRGLAPDQLQQLAQCASPATFTAGQCIFHEGTAADQFYILTHGQVALQIAVPGRGSITIQTLGTHDVLGWSWLYPPYRWHFDACTLTLVRAIAFDAQALRRMCEEDHDLGYELVKRFAQVMFDRLQATRLQLLDVYGSH
jgi:CRP/FNR family cyclic AMP-dependent transcriptional regulator